MRVRTRGILLCEGGGFTVRQRIHSVPFSFIPGDYLTIVSANRILSAANSILESDLVKVLLSRTYPDVYNVP